jgi:hypothetical protein
MRLQALSVSDGFYTKVQRQDAAVKRIWGRDNVPIAPMPATNLFQATALTRKLGGRADAG